MTQKNYSNSELFTVANKIRKETGCSKKEAFAKAKMELESKVAKKAEKKTSAGKRGMQVKITAKTKEKILTKYNLTEGTVYPSVKALAEYMNTSVQNVMCYIYNGCFEKV